MMIWRKVRLVKKYIKKNIEDEIRSLLYKTIRNEDSSLPHIRYSKRLDSNEQEELEKDEIPAIDNSDIVFTREEVSDSSSLDILDDSNLKEKISEKIDYTWQQSLFKLIDDKSIDEVELYKKSGITKQTFSKIRSDEKYHPDKDTAIRLCMGLELSLEDSLDLLGKAGFTLSKSIERDLVFRYFIENKEYDLYIIDPVLEKLKLKLLLKY